MHLKESKEPVQNGMDENHVVQTGSLHHGMHRHLQTVENERSQAEG